MRPQPVILIGLVVIGLFFLPVAANARCVNCVVVMIPVGGSPLGIAFAPSNSNIYVINIGNFGPNGFSSTVSVISTSTNTVIDTIPLPTGFYPTGIAFASSNNDIYVAGVLPDRNSSPSSESDTVYAISTTGNAIVATIQLGSSPNYGRYLWVTFAPSTNNIYVTNGNTETISVVSTTTNILLETFLIELVPKDTSPIEPAPSYLGGLAFAPSDNDIYVASGGNKTVFAIDTFNNTIVAAPSTGWSFTATFSPSNNDIYVANLDHSVSVISTSTNTRIATIQVPTGYEIGGIGFAPSSNEIYAAGVGNSFPTSPPDGLLSTVFVICASTNSLIDSIPLPNGSDPSSVAFAASSNEIYVASANAHTVVAILTVHNHPVPRPCGLGAPSGRP